MSETTDNTDRKPIDVLIVGAGLSGLMMAAQLLRHGTYPMIIDQKLGPDKHQRAASVVLHARSMELLHQLGLDEAVMQLGQQQIRWNLPGIDLSLDLETIDDPDTYFRGRWIVPARELEQLLIDYLTLKACKIHWGMQLTGMTETDTAVSVEIIPELPPSRTVDWVIGADGADSGVRRALGFSFEGVTDRVASRFAGRRSFLIGEAAYSASSYTRRDSEMTLGQLPQPMEDQAYGADAGFQDAWNLGWKLAGVVSGQLDQRILLSYHDERHPFSKGGRRDGTHRWLQTLRYLHRRLPGFVRTGTVLWDRWLRARSARWTQLFKTLSGLSISYRHAATSVHYSASEQVKAGDRFPWHALFDEKRKSPTDTREIFRKPGFVLVVMGHAGSHMIHVMGQWIRQKYPQGLGLYYIPYSARNQPIFDRFGMPPGAVQAILVRPDTYIAYMNNSINTFLIDHYLEEVIGWKHSGIRPTSRTNAI